MRYILLQLILATAAALPVLAQDAPVEPISAAVLDFQTSGEGLAGKGEEAAVLMNVHLSSSPNLFLVERQELQKILGEQELGLSGTVSPETAAKVGNLVGAKVLVVGRIFKTGDKYYMVAKVIGTETSRVYGETSTFADLGAIGQATEELAAKVAAVVEKKGGTLVAKVETPAARIERLKKLTTGKALPSVTVQVKEEHIQRAVIDPAVQTELQNALQQLGFKVIDPESSNEQPAIRITGEAFSEFGARRGDLVACRARVEIKVIDTQTGKLLLSDRQTEAGVDLAEAVAGKKALENAARALLDRIVEPSLKK